MTEVNTPSVPGTGQAPGWNAVQGPQAHQSPPTIFDLASNLKMRQQGKRGRVSVNAPFVTDGIKPVKFRNQVGFFMIQPEELASLKVPIVDRSSGKVAGYQRPLRPVHAFDIAWALQRNEPMPVIEVSLDEVGDAYITDGQHRAVGAIIARKPLKVVVEQRTYEEARRMFVNQTFAKKLDKSHMAMVGTDAMSLYVQDALTNPKHPWHNLVHEKSNKITPASMHRLVTMYGCNTIGSLTPQLIEKVQTRFDPQRADDFAPLIAVFGTDGNGNFSTKNHPFAYRAFILSALGQTAVHVLLRADDIHPGPDRERWMRHMPQFNWAGHAYINSGGKMVDAFIEHWNKKMTARRVTRKPYTRLDW